MPNPFRLSFACLLLTFLWSCNDTSSNQENTTEQPQEVTYPTTGSIERLTPAMDEIIAPGTAPEILATGFNWSEGPLWLPEEELLIFSDVPENQIYQWKPGDTVATVYLEPSGFTGETTTSREPGSNGLALDNQGRLLLAQHADRRIARMDAPLGDPKPEFTTLADTYQEKRFNSPNDLVIDSEGRIYFTDPPYGLGQMMEDPLKEIPFQGVYRIDPDGEVALLVDSLTRPNGIALSPDEQTLYVAISDPEGARWMAYDLDEEGQITGGRIFYDATPQVGKAAGVPDGMKVDSQGRIFATGPGGVWVISPEGEHLGTINTGQATANVALGPEDSILYITADSLLLRVPLGN